MWTHSVWRNSKAEILCISACNDPFSTIYGGGGGGSWGFFVGGWWWGGLSQQPCVLFSCITLAKAQVLPNLMQAGASIWYNYRSQLNLCESNYLDVAPTCSVKIQLSFYIRITDPSSYYLCTVITIRIRNTAFKLVHIRRRPELCPRGPER
jgi:hypothetical protein